jgi:flagellar protein FliT
MNAQLISYYEAIEKASGDMLDAARTGDWDEVCKLEGACALLIAQLKHAANDQQLDQDEKPLKAQLMQRILLNDAEIRRLAEPWLDDIEQQLSSGMGSGKPTLH